MLQSIGSTYIPHATRTGITSGKKYSNSSSHQTSISSTPHAPRQKKPVALPKSKAPSTHDLLKQHSYLEEDLFNCISPTGGSRHVAKATPPSVRQSAKATPPSVRQAWSEPTVVVRPKLVQPYRRSGGRKAPLGVPLLDLSALNEPDENMAPVKLLPRQELDDETARDGSVFSWGIRRTYTPQVNSDTEEAPVINEEMKVDEVTGDEPGSSARKSTSEEQPLVRMESAKMNFVENKLLSYEQIKEVPSYNLLPTGGSELAKPSVATFGPSIGIPTASLSKRLRFEARIVTQNGRDVHRELCGFYFLVDGSIAIYEYRQFGKKSSALPLIQRGVFSHLTGHRKGQQYDISYIRKGSLLHFRPREHPNLPDSLTSRPLLTIKITQVDERNKRQLLCTGRNPVECRSIEAYLAAPLSSSEEKENSLLKTLQGMVCSRLRGRASKVLVGLGRYLRSNAMDDTISKLQLEQAMRTFHISLTVEDYHQLWQLLKSSELATDSGLCVDSCIPLLVGGMSEDRMSLVRKVFHKVDASKTGSIAISEMKKFFNASLYPDVVKGQRTVEEVWIQLIDSLTENYSEYMFREQKLHHSDTVIKYADFENYYEGLSVEISRDIDFINLIRNCWAVN